MDTAEQNLTVRTYGSKGPNVILLHGGPGAAGYMAPVAEKLKHRYKIIEPFQRHASKEKPVTVDSHIRDLNNVIKSYCNKSKPILAGHSWGAMLALAYTAKYPETAESLILIGIGTFDEESRRQMQINRQNNTDAKTAEKISKLNTIKDPDARLEELGNIMLKTDSHQLMPVKNEIHKYDSLSFEQTWDDMIAKQKAGIYPKAFAKISTPVSMLHGSRDPHPGKMIHKNLVKYMPQLEYIEFQRCGHYPWLEKHAHQAFYHKLNEKLQN